MVGDGKAGQKALDTHWFAQQKTVLDLGSVATKVAWVVWSILAMVVDYFRKMVCGWTQDLDLLTLPKINLWWRLISSRRELFEPIHFSIHQSWTDCKVKGTGQGGQWLLRRVCVPCNIDTSYMRKWCWREKTNPGACLLIHNTVKYNLHWLLWIPARHRILFIS